MSKGLGTRSDSAARIARNYHAQLRNARDLLHLTQSVLVKDTRQPLTVFFPGDLQLDPRDPTHAIAGAEYLLQNLDELLKITHPVDLPRDAGYLARRPGKRAINSHEDLTFAWRTFPQALREIAAQDPKSLELSAQEASLLRTRCSPLIDPLPGTAVSPHFTISKTLVGSTIADIYCGYRIDLKIQYSFRT